VLAACSPGAPEATPSTTSPATIASTTTLPRASDGRLMIGVLLPSTGSGAQIGSPLISAVRNAVDIINEAGGVLGQPVVLVEADEGGSSSSAAAALDTLLAQGVDAIIGPASSLNALAVASSAVAAGIPMCSPTVQPLSLSTTFLIMV
jgi:branched-chain amino acid transport system substrate-binding protein